MSKHYGRNQKRVASAEIAKLNERIQNLMDVIAKETERREGIKTIPVESLTWLPIETAPKDGTKILVCRATDADGEPMGESLSLFTQRAAWWEGDDDWIVFCSLVQEPACFFKPTHWMHIPPMN
jgi:hypothetical protein